MNHFRPYDHLERLGHRNVQNIEIGLVHVFPKLDGTNSSVWFDGERTQCASRRRVISLEEDNAGFARWVLSDDTRASDLRALCAEHPTWIIYGEWMVPHTLRTYRQEIWNCFWIFDVYDRERGTYLAFEEYAPICAQAGQHVIQPLCTISNPSEAQLLAQVETNTYLIEQGAGLGEGVVLKNYAWRQHGNPWAKVVRNVFKEEAALAFGHAEKTGEYQVEVDICDRWVTAHLVGKTRAKVVLDVANDLGIDVTTEVNWQQRIESENRGKVIPQLLGRVYHDLITEEMWAILKDLKNPTINFKKLQQLVTLAVKALAADLF
jgi:RNA ligase-like protein